MVILNPSRESYTNKDLGKVRVETRQVFPTVGTRQIGNLAGFLVDLNEEIPKVILHHSLLMNFLHLEIASRNSGLFHQGPDCSTELHKGFWPLRSEVSNGGFPKPRISDSEQFSCGNPIRRGRKRSAEPQLFR